MRFYVQDDIQIARRASIRTVITLLLITYPGAILDSGRHAYFDAAFTSDRSFTLALGTGIGHDPSSTITSRTGTGNTEETLLISNLAAAGASRTGNRTF